LTELKGDLPLNCAPEAKGVSINTNAATTHRGLREKHYDGEDHRLGLAKRNSGAMTIYGAGSSSDASLTFSLATGTDSNGNLAVDDIWTVSRD